MFCLFFFFNDTATTEIYTLSLHDALPISSARPATRSSCPRRRERAGAGAIRTSCSSCSPRSRRGRLGRNLRRRGAESLPKGICHFVEHPLVVGEGAGESLLDREVRLEQRFAGFFDHRLPVGGEHEQVRAAVFSILHSPDQSSID